MDAALGFWLQYVDSEGGLTEVAADRTLVMLPPSAQRACRLPEELTVTSDPDVAREDGTTLLSPGHPILASAADHVLAGGDVGMVAIPRPASVPPSAEVLLTKARDQFPVDHGKIDLAGGIRPALRQVVRVGVLLEYSVSAESRLQERAECWVDATACLELPPPVRTSLSRNVGHAVVAADAVSAGDAVGTRGEVLGALLEAHNLLAARAGLRLDELAADAAQDYAGERDRAQAYYDSALASIARRRATAPPDRAALLDARAESTRQERDRRLAEIAEKHQPQYQFRPFRLHVLVVPVMRLPVHVRRGERRYLLDLDWLIPAGTFAGVRCPHCGEPAELVATKSRLGCRSCLSPAPALVTAPSSKRGGPTGAPGSDSRPVVTERPAADARPAATVAPRRAAAAVPPPRAAALQRIAPRLTEAEISAAGHKLSFSFWRAAGADSKKLRGKCSMGSPAATAVTLFGGYGPFRAIGVPVADPPRSMSVALSDARPGRRNITVGAIETDSQRYAYQLTWHFEGNVAVVDEVIPCGHQFGSRGPASILFQAGTELFAELPPPKVRLDGVARQIWKVTLHRHGLPLVLRCITAWWRVVGEPGESATLAAAEFRIQPPAVVAAALERMVSYRATGFGVYADVAAAYGVGEADVRTATPTLQRHLQLSASRLW